MPQQKTPTFSGSEFFGAILGITCTPFGCSKICLCWFNFLALPKIHSTKTLDHLKSSNFIEFPHSKIYTFQEKPYLFHQFSLPKSRPQGSKASRNGLPQRAVLRLHRRPTAAAPERRPAVPAPRRAATGGAAAGRCGRRCLWIWHRDVAW